MAEKLTFEYDDRSDALTIEAMDYASGGFRELGGRIPTNGRIKVDSMGGGVFLVTIPFSGPAASSVADAPNSVDDAQATTDESVATKREASDA